MSETAALSTPAPIMPPPDFPVIWEHPDDVHRYWQLDRQHFPAPLTPLSFEYSYFEIMDGLNPAARTLGERIAGDTRRINTYYYETYSLAEIAPEAPDTEGQQKAIEIAMSRLDTDWREAFLPEIEQHLADWAAWDLHGASLPELLGYLDETVIKAKRLWTVHFLAWLPAMTAISQFEDLCHELFGEKDAFDPYRLLLGFDNKTLEADRALWRLSRTACATPAVRSIIEKGTYAEMLAMLEASRDAQPFVAELRAYLRVYGLRNNKCTELDDPSWIEDPSPVFHILKEYVGQQDRDPDAHLSMLAAERERLVAAARCNLHDYPQPVVERFEFLLKAAQVGLFISEEHAFWIDQRTSHYVRQVVLELGRRLAHAGVLDQIDDVFYLNFQELRETAAALPRIDRRRTVAGRRAEVAYFRTIQPPPALGTPPSGPPPTDPLSRAVEKFVGVPPPLREEPDILHGHAGSPGTVRGPARVLRSLAEADRLQSGDILVAEMTAPQWTPLFSIACAVVTDTGGILSHCAVVAREYCIPAVVGTGTATAVIQDGQMLEVNGNAGIVRLIATHSW
jgi:pyruvate,water dikinase